jgi:hypothetical protein
MGYNKAELLFFNGLIVHPDTLAQILREVRQVIEERQHANAGAAR